MQNKKIIRTFTLKRLTILAVLASQAIVLSVVESWIPVSIGVPGVKLGLANIITLVMLNFFPVADALIVVFVRCALASLFSGGPVIFLFSISGGILSMLVMWLILRLLKRWFSLVGISIAGSVTHNIAQIGVACLIMSDISVAGYLPVLRISGIIMGLFVGLCSSLLVKELRKRNIISERIAQ